MFFARARVHRRGSLQQQFAERWMFTERHLNEFKLALIQNEVEQQEASCAPPRRNVAEGLTIAHSCDNAQRNSIFNWTRLLGKPHDRGSTCCDDLNVWEKFIVSGSKFVEGARNIVIRDPWLSGLNSTWLRSILRALFGHWQAQIGNENKNVLRRLLGLEMESCCPPQKKAALGGGGDVVWKLFMLRRGMKMGSATVQASLSRRVETRFSMIAEEINNCVSAQLRRQTGDW